MCQACPVGTASNLSGAHNCSDCRVGSYAATSGKNICDECASPASFRTVPGISAKFCAPVNFRAGLELRLAQIASQARTLPRLVKISVKIAAPASFDSPRESACQFCAPGTFSGGSGAQTCEGLPRRLVRCRAW